MEETHTSFLYNCLILKMTLELNCRQYHSAGGFPHFCLTPFEVLDINGMREECGMLNRNLGKYFMAKKAVLLCIFLVLHRKGGNYVLLRQCAKLLELQKSAYFMIGVF